ncbi:methylase of polypeptide subunit release factors [Brevibacterium pityocampae]
MTPSPASAPLPQPDVACLRALAERLRAAQFTPAGLRALWGVDADAALQRNNATPARLRLRGRSEPQAVLAGLFVLRVPQPVTAVRAALGEDLCDSLTESGLFVEIAGVAPALSAGMPLVRPVAPGSAATNAATQGDSDSTSSAQGDSTPSAARPTASPPRLMSRLALTPYAVPAGVPRGQRPGDETVWLFSDHGTLTQSEPVSDDFVLGLGGAGRTLAEITPRHRVHSALDLGTGCGIQAILLARHADRVVATDFSIRALHLAALTAQLNGVEESIEFRLGSLFDPVPESFDLIVSNPPFVITPQGRDGQLEYRDGGMEGDGIMRTLLAQTPGHLRPDGHAVFLGNWEYGPDTVDPTGWVGDAQTSIMVIERERLDPVAYAETWIRDGGVARATQRWAADTEAWLADFASRSVDRIGFGWVRMHRLPGEASELGATAPGAGAEAGAGAAGAENSAAGTSGSAAAVRHFEELDQPLGANAAGIAAHLDTRLAMLEWLAAADDAELAETAFVRSGDVTEHRHFMPGQEAPTMITLEQGTGFARTFASDPALSGFLGVADGSLTLGAVAAALSGLLEVEESALRAQLIAQVRTLVPAGVVYPQV